MNNEVKKTEQAPTQQLSIGQFLRSKENQINLALPRHMTADKILRIAMTEIQRNPELGKCTQMSLIGALINSAQLGLWPDSLLGEAYLIPFRNNNKGGIIECQFMVGYKGMIKLIYNSGMIASIDAHEVCANDEFSYEYGSNSHLKHKPALKNRGEVICYYAIYKMKGKESDSVFLVMSPEDVDKHKAFSKSAGGKYSPWTTAYDEMAKKTCIRSLFKYAPKSAEDNNLSKAIAEDERADLGIQDNSLIFSEADVVEEKPISKASKLVEAIKQSEPIAQPKAESIAQNPIQPEIGILKQFENIMLTCKTKDALDDVADDINLAKESGKLSAAEAALLREIYNNCEKKLG